MDGQMIALLIVGLAFVAASWRLGTLFAEVAEKAIDRQLTVQERQVTLDERRLTLEEAIRKPRAKAQPMPPELRARIAAFEDDWARDDEERTLMALYAEYDDWEMVKKNLRPITPVTDSDTPFAPAPDFIR